MAKKTTGTKNTAADDTGFHMPHMPHMPKFTGLGTHPILGMILAVASAFALGVTPSFAKLSYQEGSSVLWIILIRSGLFPVISLFFYSIIIKNPLNLHKIPRKAILLVSVSISMTAFGLMNAITYISPNLAVVILFSFPLIVLAIVSVLNRKIPSVKLLLIYFIAFVGLVMAIGPAYQDISWLGVGLAFFGAIGASMLMFVGHISGEDIKAHSMLFIGSLSVTSICIVTMLIKQDIAMPVSSFGWGALLVAGGCYTAGMLMVIGATTVLRPDVATLFMNVEPFVGIATAYLLLGDILSPLQMMGVIATMLAISIGGIVSHKEHMEPDHVTLIEHS